MQQNQHVLYKVIGMGTHQIKEIKEYLPNIAIGFLGTNPLCW